MIGRHVSHYEIISRFDTGGMGEVYRARDTRLDRTVVLKFLPPMQAEDADARERFFREARAASRLNHASICTIYDIDQIDDGTQFISMAFCDGDNLADLLDHGPLPPVESARIALRVAEGLSCAHAQGVIHRDLKPANIQITSDREVKILDFGVAQLAGQERLTTVGTTVGTVPYMSPEQASGDEVDLTTDLWWLGVVLFEMLTGQRPSQGESYSALVQAIMTKPAPDPVTISPAVPLELAEIVRWCLEKRPQDRPRNAMVLLEPLRAQARAADDAKTVTVSTRRRTARRRRQSIWRAGATLLAVALLALVATHWSDLTGRGDGIDRHGVTLLPWTVIGGDLRDQALGDGLVQYLTDEMLLLETYQPDGWTTPTTALLAADISSTDKARGRLGVGDAVSGTLHVQGDLLRLKLLMHDTGARGGGQVSRPPSQRTIVGMRSDLVTWTDEILRTLVELVGWQPAPADRRPPTSGETHNSRALAFYLDGLGELAPFCSRTCDRDAAREAFAASAAADSGFSLPHVGLARLYMRGLPPSGAPDLAAALAACDAALARGPELLDAHFLKGRILENLGDPAALDAFRRCQELSPGHWLSLGRLVDLLVADGQVDRAETLLHEAIAAKPDRPEAHARLGVLLLGEERLEESAASLRRVIALAPDNIDAFSNLGAVAYRREHWDEAEAMFLRAVAIEPDAVSYQNLGTVYFYQHRLADAGRMYEAAALMTPTDYHAYAWAAECYWWSGGNLQHARSLYARAAAVADSTLRRRPGDLELSANLASYLIRLGDTVRARELLDAVADQAPHDVNIRYVLATSYEDLGERALAIEYAEAALRGGYPRWDLERYPGFDGLRRSPEYQAMLARVDAQAESR